MVRLELRDEKHPGDQAAEDKCGCDQEGLCSGGHCLCSEPVVGGSAQYTGARARNSVRRVQRAAEWSGRGDTAGMREIVLIHITGADRPGVTAAFTRALSEGDADVLDIG